MEKEEISATLRSQKLYKFSPLLNNCVIIPQQHKKLSIHFRGVENNKRWSRIILEFKCERFPCGSVVIKNRIFLPIHPQTGVILLFRSVTNCYVNQGIKIAAASSSSLSFLPLFVVFLFRLYGPTFLSFGQTFYSAQHHYAYNDSHWATLLRKQQPTLNIIIIIVVSHSPCRQHLNIPYRKWISCPSRISPNCLLHIDRMMVRIVMEKVY